MTLAFAKGMLFQGTEAEAEPAAIDSAALAVIINNCFKAARSERFTRAQRGYYYGAGVALRDQFKILVGKWFVQETDQLVEANKKIKEVNAELQTALGAINQAAKTIESLGELVDQLTELVGIVALL